MISKVSDADLNAFMTAARETTQLDLGYEIGQRYARLHLAAVDLRSRSHLPLGAEASEMEKRGCRQ